MQAKAMAKQTSAITEAFACRNTQNAGQTLQLRLCKRLLTAWRWVSSDHIGEGIHIFNSSILQKTIVGVIIISVVVVLRICCCCCCDATTKKKLLL